MFTSSYDALVVGAGPGGATAATFMARDGLRVLLIDKSGFPRDKICGDAISGKSVNILQKLGVIEQIQTAESLDSWGVIFSGPYGDEVAIPFTKDLSRPVPPGFLCSRVVYDNLLLEAAQEAGATVAFHTEVEDLLWENDQVVGVRLREKGSPPQDVYAPLVVGADGAYSVVARKLGIDQLDEKHYFAAIRCYYEGVTGFHQQNYIELHFVEEAVPGYFWIFPLPDGRANVGLGSVSASIKKRRTKLKPLLDTLTDHPRFRDRFADARRITPVKGWGMPLGSKPRQMAGPGWMLLGDAASLIDPFTGEGIGNAMVSGEQAARWANKAKTAQDYSAAFLQGYTRDTMAVLHYELRMSHTMQRLMSWKWPLNFVIRRAARSTAVADAISCMFEDLNERSQLTSPLFYLRLLTTG